MSGNFLYLAGQYFNHFAWPGATVSASPAVAASGPAAHIYDNDPSTPHIDGTIAADGYSRVRFSALTNSGFETSTLDGWISGNLGTGTSTETVTAGEFRSGSKALKMSGTDSSNYGSRSQTIDVRSGQTRKATVWSRQISGTGTIFKLFLFNPYTGHYWSAGNQAWQTTRDHALSRAYTGSPAYGVSTVEYTVESYEVVRGELAKIVWELVCDEGSCAIDDVSDLAGINFASIHGHNYNVLSPLVQSSDDGAAWTTRATMTVKQGSFYTTFATVFAEYWQIKRSGTNYGVAAYAGEEVLGEYQTSVARPRWDPVVDREIPGSRQFGTALRPSAYPYCSDPAESIGLTFLAENADAEKDTYERLWLRTAGGKYPAIFVPRSDEAAIYFGHLMKPYSNSRPFADARPVSLYLNGSPLPTVGL